MSFKSKAIGIGNLTNLKKRTKKNLLSGKDIPIETEDSDIAQLSVDVYETNDQLIIVAPLAGVDSDDVRIEITEDVVIIEGEREYPLVDSESDGLLVQECYFGRFSRSIVLPEAVDSKKASARFRKSVLILSIPKLDSVRTRVIKIQSDK